MNYKHFVRRYWEWLLIVPMYGWLFYLQNAYQRPSTQIGLTWFGSALATWALLWTTTRMRANAASRRSEAALHAFTDGSAMPPVMFQMNVQAHRIDRAVRDSYPDDVERVILYGGFDGKVDDLKAIVLLKGAMGDTLSAPFPGDPEGAWMFDDTGREKLKRIRSIVWSYAMAIGDAHFKPPVIFTRTGL